MLKTYQFKTHCKGDSHNFFRTFLAGLRVIREWKLEGKVVAVCTDNAANITAAVKLKHLPCFAHTLNLVVQKGVATLAAIQMKVKAIVAHFHRSTVAAEKLRSLQQQMQPDNITSSCV